MSQNQPITCTCRPYGVLHRVTCPIGRLMLEVAQRNQSSWNVERGFVSFSPGYLRRVEREEENALAGRRTDWRFVRPEVVALCAQRGLPVKAPKPHKNARRSSRRPSASGAFDSASFRRH